VLLLTPPAVQGGKTLRRRAREVPNQPRALVRPGPHPVGGLQDEPCHPQARNRNPLEDGLKPAATKALANGVS
jgi:hypothetical protein